MASADVSRETLERSFSAYGVPRHLRDGLADYVMHGRPIGGFLRYCLENNFAEAVVRAGADLRIDDLVAIAKWMFNEAPKRCWGSPGIVKTWRGE